MNSFLPDGDGARRRRDRVLLALAAILAFVLVLRALSKDDGVLVRNQEFGARFLAGEDPYFDPARGHRVHGPYPPSYALVTVPLSLVPTPVARGLWALAQVGALAAAFVALRRWAERGWPALAPHASVVFALALLLDSRFLLRDMAGGGGNLLFATCALWGLEWLFAGRDLRAGLAFAVPLVLKPNLAPLLVFVACRGRWKCLAATATSALVLYGAPALARGAEDYLALTERWCVDVLAFARAENLADAREIPDGMPAADTTMNQSLREALWRLLEPATAAMLARGLGVLLVAAACVFVRRARGARSEVLGALAFLPLCLLVSPISWKAHHAVLLPLFFVLLLVALERRGKPVWSILAIYYVACVLLSEEFVGKAGKEVLQRASIVTWGALALFVATCALTERESKVARGATDREAAA